MAFNGGEFNRIKTSATVKKLNNLSSTYNLIVRSSSPLRGFTIKWKDKQDRAVKECISLQERCLASITSNYGELSGLNNLLTGEQFQMQQKGPAAPISLEDIQKVLDKLISNNRISLTKRIIDEFDSAIEEFFKNFSDSIHVNPKTINYADSGRLLPNQTVRGFPYHSLGKDVDDEIIKMGGSTLESAFKYFKSQSQNVCFPGWRIQGKPWPGPAKARIVNIPSVSYQYLMVGLTKEIMQRLQNQPFFDGGKDEISRVQNISNMITEARSSGYNIIQLDYSAFDQNIHPYFRIKVGEMFARHFTDADFSVEFIKQFENYSNNQFLFVGSTSKVGEGQLIELPMQLLSGVIDTQLTGSIINGVLQNIICKRLGYEPIFKYQRGLGDDALLPVPNSLISELGYVNVLERISDVLNEFGFKLNPSKAYPNTDAAFLQKLYVPSKYILGNGSGCRNIASFFFKEKFTKKIKGIKNIAALEIISQISIISQVYPIGGDYGREFSQEFANGGVKEDKLLCAVINKLRDSRNLSPNSLFEILVKISGATYEQILEHMDLLSYDHTHLSEKLHSRDYAKVFPILRYLCNSEEVRGLINEDLKELLDEVNSRMDFSSGSDDDILDD